MSEVELVKELHDKCTVLHQAAGFYCLKCRAADTITRLLKERDEARAERDEEKRISDKEFFGMNREWNVWMRAAIARAEAAEAQVAALTKALEKIGKSDYERSGRHRYGGSKNDTCDHDNAYWDECFECCSSFARKALETSR